jgi:hypothetical protein
MCECPNIVHFFALITTQTEMKYHVQTMYEVGRQGGDVRGSWIPKGVASMLYEGEQMQIIGPECRCTHQGRTFCTCRGD